MVFALCYTIILINSRLYKKLKVTWRILPIGDKMGITAPLAEMIVFEHKYRPISGRVLSLGCQTILFGPGTLRTLI